MNLKEIHYGIEIETVKRTREQIAWAIHSVVGGTVRQDRKSTRLNSSH